MGGIELRASAGNLKLVMMKMPRLMMTGFTSDFSATFGKQYLDHTISK